MIRPTPSDASAARIDGPSVLFGRSEELAFVDEQIDRLVLGTGGAWTYVGAVGSGKSALLAEVRRIAADQGILVVEAVGVEGGDDLPWAAVADLCVPFAAEIEALGSRRGRALRAALALDQAEDGPIDALGVALGLLEVLVEASDVRPVLLVVDDLPWIDVESRRALAFVARRLGDDPVAIAAGARAVAGEPTATVGDAVPLGRLDDEAARALAARHGVRARSAQDAVVATAAGRPLLVGALARSLTSDQRVGARPVAASLRLPTEMRDLYAAPVQALPERSRRALGVLAADTSGEVAIVGAALGRLDLSLIDLEPAEESGLVHLAGARVEFDHPLVRSAAYHSSTAPARRRAHVALAAEVGEGEPAGIYHRAAAAVGPDAELADALTELGRSSAERGAPLSAVPTYVHAADLTPDAPTRAARLLLAADAAVEAGEPTWAGELLGRALATAPEHVGDLDVARVAVHQAGAAGRYEDARRAADAAAVAHGAERPVEVAGLLLDAARPLVVLDPLATGALVDRAKALLAQAGVESLRAEVLGGCASFVLGDPASHEAIARWPELLDQEGAVAAGAFLAESVVLYLGYSGKRKEALELLERIEGPVREHCSTASLVPVLIARAYLTYGSDLGACVAAGREALDLCDTTGFNSHAPIALDVVALAAAGVGDEELVRELCDRLLADGTERSEVWARIALARLHLVKDQAEGAAEQVALLRDRVGDVAIPYVRWEADAAEALVRVGRVDEARALVGPLEVDAEARGGWAEGQLQRILALLAPTIDEAVVHFEAAATAFAGTDNRITQGITELTWGEWLRRAKRRAEARRHLERAIERFRLVGATGFIERAEAELAAAGGSADRNRPTSEQLAPLELQIARLAVDGQTNRAIADVLFLSPRTVENRLGAVYRKLGVSGRAALVARAATDPDLRTTAD